MKFNSNRESRNRYNEKLETGRMNCILLLLIFAIILILWTVRCHLWITITIASVSVIALLIYVAKRIIDARYMRFVLDHSIAIKELQRINGSYNFAGVPSFDMRRSFDNEKMFDTLSPWDYLTYQLVNVEKDVEKAMEATESNCARFPEYQKEVEEARIFGLYEDTNRVPMLRKYLEAKERKIFNEFVYTPRIEFSITVCLELTNIKGSYIGSWSEEFGTLEIRNVISRLHKKNNDFYQDPDIWDAICRVERAMVTNKMRFAIYKRDDYRCCRCGSMYDLEIDHIYPISKGGKSTFNNLQTLCHRCNAQKSNTVEKEYFGYRNNTMHNTRVCGFCGAPLVIKSGKMGRFYGCSNYPKCKFTKQIY